MSILVLIYMQRIRKEKVIKSLPSVSDHSGYEQNDKSHQQYQIYTCENMIFKEIPKNLSDVRIKQKKCSLFFYFRIEKLITRSKNSQIKYH